MQLGATYIMPKAQLNSAEKSRLARYQKRASKKPNKVIWSESQIRQRIKDKVVKERFKSLGYCKGGASGHYPCLCGDYPDENPVWWMGGTNSKPDHLLCLRCKKHVYEDDIAKAIQSWHKMKAPKAFLRKALTK
jgi:hypothetical protein